MNVWTSFTVAAAIVLSDAVAADGLLDCVNTLIGTESRREDTSNSAGMVPAVCVPFGGVKWVPMTRLTEVGRVSYLAGDPHFLGFIGTRQPSPWMGDFGQFSVMARVGETDCDYATRGYPFDRSKCVFTPYYCKVVDDRGIVSEVTASSHAAWMRFTFPKGVRRHLVLDASRRFTWKHSDKRPFPGGVEFGADRRVVRVWNTDRPDAHFGPPLANWRADVRIELSEAYVRCGTYVEGKPPDEGRSVEADQCGGWVEFAPDVDVVTLRIGTSTIGDPEGVVRRELGGDGFDAIREKTRAQWDEKLSVVRIDADDDCRRVFATALYHALMYPAEFSEGGRYYSGFDDRIHEGSCYTSFSLWDTYRAEHPFLTIFAPERVDGMIRSLLQMYREGGYLPKWPNLSYTGIMVGGPAEIVIAEAVRKGFRGFDLDLAYEAVKKNATVPTPNDGAHDWPSRGHWSGYPETRGGLTTYQTLGYVACDRTDESVSRTQDFGHDDLAAAVLADAVGRPDEAARFRARSKSYTNLWNAARGTFWPKRADGSWAETASPRGLHPAYTEQFWQTAVWGVPYDVPGLVDLLGGREAMERKLDDYFGNYFYQNHHGKMSHHENEPSHHIAYLYAAIGCHDKCARQVRRILTTCYAPDAWGMEGNDDCGQMSAWYVLSALGLYPLDPTSGEYVIGSPLVRRAEVRIGAPYSPAVLTVIARNQSRENGLVRRVLLNGVELRERRVRHADLVAGGTLEFEMAPFDNPSAGFRKEPAGDARWIWYPGDYGLWWGNELQSQRLQWGSRLTPFWPLYAPEPRVLFRRDGLDLREDDELEVRCDGHAAFCYTDAKGVYHESSVIANRFLLPKEAKRIEIKVQNTVRPPSVWVKGRSLVSDASWTAGWTTSWDLSENVPVDSSARFTDPETPPGLKKLPVREKAPKWERPYKGNHVIADFGEETFGYLRLKDVKGRGAVKIIYAESEPEMYAEELATTDRRTLDGWERIELSETPEFRREIAHGFRYVHVIPVEGDVTVGSVSVGYEWKDVPVRGSFRCNDEEINRIWDVSVHTLELTCREVFIEGVKRDRWVWSGDAVQSFLMNYYVFGDYDGCRDTLWTLRGKDPVKCHLNRIMDYTFYWFEAVEKYRLYSGDANFARQVYPRMRSLMEFAIGRLDAEGRPADRPGDWMFIDWAPKPLPNTGGVTSFEQMLFVRALEATAAVAEQVGERDDAAAYRSRAAKLKAEIVPRYWSDEKGGLLHMIYSDGRVDPLITRYPNMFGLFYGYFNAEQRDSVVRNVIFNDEVLGIQTPYMRFYELEALCALGRQEDVLRDIRSYWGGMLRLGATSFWELYNPNESGDGHFAMYGRRFGKSLCHAWGASPAYLLGKYFLGVAPTSPGFATYDVKPNLGGLDWIEGDVPTPWGRIHVRADRRGHTVTEHRQPLL